MIFHLEALRVAGVIFTKQLEEQMELQTYEPSERTKAQLDKSFTYHPPKGSQQSRYEAIRDEAKCLAETMVRNAPESRELSLALTNLEQAVMWANAAIARNE